MKNKIAGPNSIMEAIKGKRRIYKIFVQEGKGGKKITDLIELARKKGIFVQYVEKERLDNMFKVTNHQGVVAQVEEFEYADLEEVLEKARDREEDPFIIILDGIEDPQNFGAIIRTAECAGVHGIIIPRHQNVEVTAAVGRASSGAVEHMLIVQEHNLVNVMEALKEKGFWVIGADMQGNQPYTTVDLKGPLALVIGGENRGLRRLVKEKSDILVKIPTLGLVDSLNASAAAAVLMYEVLRQRKTGEMNG